MLSIVCLKHTTFGELQYTRIFVTLDVSKGVYVIIYACFVYVARIDRRNILMTSEHEQEVEINVRYT
jgi:hypothetical protein